MNSVIKLTLVVLITFSQSCDSTKKVANTNADTVEAVTETMNKKLITEGYSVGVIKQMESKGDCDFVIFDEKSNNNLDPININEEKFKAFKVKGAKVYYKYSSLRMMNRCPEARPVQIIDMKKG